MTNLSNSPHFAALVKFIEAVNAKKDAYWKMAGYTYNTAGKVEVHNVGKRYARLATCEQVPHMTGPYKATSCYCFFDISTGDLLKGSWKAPVAKGVRGNVNDANVMDKFTHYGPVYLR